MAELEVGNEFAQFLIDEGIAVDMKDADGVHPVVADSPRDGAPLPVLAPNDGLDFRPGTITVTTWESPSGEDHSRSKTVVQLLVRGPDNATAKLIIRQIQSVLVPEDLWGGKSLFPMGAIASVDHCTPFRAPRPVAVSEDSYDWDIAFELLIRRKVLAEQA